MSPLRSCGCGNFGGIGSAPAFFGQGETREQAFAIMDAAYEAGITTFETADAYGGGRSEAWIGEWLRSRKPQDVVLSTKTFNPMDEGLDHGLGRWAEIHRPRPALAAAEHVEADVRGDAVEP